ncbi:MAG: hypothetical protein LPD71_04050 [Shewanella sp.]|nr:hypothetical protein [Shewanella sp.]MCF1437937.1 hypothetical protein [Shewanella sp.]
MYPVASASARTASTKISLVSASFPRDLSVLAAINDSATKLSCGPVAMRVFRYLEEGLLKPITERECVKPEPMSRFSLFGNLDDLYIWKGLGMVEATGNHVEKITEIHHKILTIRTNGHAVINFKYEVSGKGKGHFCNVLRVDRGYLILDAINREAFYRYVECQNLFEYFQLKLPRVGADQLFTLTIIY